MKYFVKWTTELTLVVAVIYTLLFLVAGSLPEIPLPDPVAPSCTCPPNSVECTETVVQTINEDHLARCSWIDGKASCCMITRVSDE